MMRRSMRIGTLVIGSMFVLAIGAHRPTEAQFGAAGGGFAQFKRPERSPAPAPRIHVAIPYETKALAIRDVLEKPISMPFETETPLGDALEHIRLATAKIEGGMEGGIPIYVDEIGLQEAEQSLQSPIKLNLEGIALKTTLRLMLDQLNLVYEIMPEGLLLITSKASRDQAADPMLLVLDELRALRAEVEDLRKQVEVRPKAGRSGMSGN